MGGSTHSFRVGGAAAYANSPSGGAMVAGFMGLWKSKAQLDYMYACRPTVEATGVEIGR